MTNEMLDFNNSILTITMLMSCLFITVISGYVYVNSQRSKALTWFLVWMALLFIWNWSYMMRRVAPNEGVAWAFLNLEILSVAFLGPVLLSFARSYRGWRNRRGWSVWLAFIGAASIAGYLFTNDQHHNFIRSFSMDGIVYGQPYYIFGLIEALCFLGALFFFVSGVKRPSIYWKNQLIHVGGSMLVLALASLIQAFGNIDLNMNMPILVLPFALIFIGIAILKYQFLDILPFAMSEAVVFIDDGYMVFDTEGELETYNPSFFRPIVDLFHAEDIGDVINRMKPYAINKMALTNLAYSLNVTDDRFISGEIALDMNDGLKYLQYTTKAMNDATGIKVASIVTFHDMTELQQLYRTLEDKKDQLMKARNQLEHHIETVQKLTVETERNRLLEQVHDTLGHSMAEVLALLEQCEILLQDDVEGREKGSLVIDEALRQSRESLVEIRAAVSKYRTMGEEL